MRLLDTPLAAIIDPNLLALIEELRELRVGEFADVHEGNLLVFLTSFFLPGDGTRFVAIRPGQLTVEYWLKAKASETNGTSIWRLYRELAYGYLDSAEDPKIYKALNSLMRPRCKPLRRKKTPPRLYPPS
jgi:hypothetical protein